MGVTPAAADATPTSSTSTATIGRAMSAAAGACAAARRPFIGRWWQQWQYCRGGRQQKASDVCVHLMRTRRAQFCAPVFEKRDNLHSRIQSRDKRICFVNSHATTPSHSVPIFFRNILNAPAPLPLSPALPPPPPHISFLPPPPHISFLSLGIRIPPSPCSALVLPHCIEMRLSAAACLLQHYYTSQRPPPTQAAPVQVHSSTAPPQPPPPKCSRPGCWTRSRPTVHKVHRARATTSWMQAALVK